MDGLMRHSSLVLNHKQHLIIQYLCLLFVMCYSNTFTHLMNGGNQLEEERVILNYMQKYKVCSASKTSQKVPTNTWSKPLYSEQEA